MLLDLDILIPLHTAISLVAPAIGFIVLAGLLRRRPAPVWRIAFLVTAFLTSATGFLFPFNVLLPSHVVGALALLTLVMVVAAQQWSATSARWRRAELIGLVVSQYWLLFVALAQAFSKVPALRDLAPTQSEGPFVLAQLALLAGFIGLGFRILSTAGPARSPRIVGPLPRRGPAS
ncbi:hypothetical protein [Falsiroseomonas frigidaquae]|uniref:hypothetical protein n=1 Tax=Falsiroseomonas frigidaquae TaxID=487318 RepID=UPI001ADFE914|nr:hypothetical protein [Falsiroseomonas frigidaquae]